MDRTLQFLGLYSAIWLYHILKYNRICIISFFFQFFLSHRGIYLLAWNMRHGYEHAGLEFWLSSIACHCPNAPVIIVGTHADQVETDLTSYCYYESYTIKWRVYVFLCLFVCLFSLSVEKLTNRLTQTRKIDNDCRVNFSWSSEHIFNFLRFVIQKLRVF